MEKEIFFVNCGKGQKDNNIYFYIDYINIFNYRSKRDYIDAQSYDRISKKVGDKHLFKTTAILNINNYDKIYICDLK